MKLRLIISCCAVLSATLSCKYLTNTEQTSDDNNEHLIASVGNSLLFKSEIINLVPHNTSFEDSIEITERFVKNWLKKELLLKEINNNVRIDLTAIERKVADYRYILLSYEYQKLVIETSLDTAVTPNEITSYYNEHKTNFALRQNIFRGRFLKVSQEAPKKDDIRQWIKSDDPQDIEALRSYAFQFADNYSLEDSVWIKFDDIIRNCPLSTISNKVQFLIKNKYIEETDSTYLYLLKIEEYKISEEISPLEFVRDDIRNIILNKRKVELTRNLKDDIYKRAKENEDYKIYR